MTDYSQFLGKVFYVYVRVLIVPFPNSLLFLSFIRAGTLNNWKIPGYQLVCYKTQIKFKRKIRTWTGI